VISLDAIQMFEDNSLESDDKFTEIDQREVLRCKLSCLWRESDRRGAFRENQISEQCSLVAESFFFFQPPESLAADGWWDDQLKPHLAARNDTATIIPPVHEVQQL
jgi:hypothetical protein